MNFLDDAKKFAKLCTKYRESDKDEDTLFKIRSLITENSQRIASNFKVRLNKVCTGLSTKHGIPLFAHSIPRMISKRGHIQQRDLTTMDVRKKVGLTGVNILLDYSGSMWFPESFNTIDGVMRIYAQNFYSLCLGTYLQKISNGKFYIQYIAVGEEPLLILETDNIDNADIDGLLVHNSWGSNEYPMDIFEGIDIHSYCNREYPVEAFNFSYKKLEGKKFKNFISMFCTDGGIHRLGESQEDRKKFLKDVVNTIEADNKVVFFNFIKTQNSTFISILKDHGQPHAEINTREEYDKVFDYFASYMNTIVRGGV